jgi:hypothetical protein
MFAGMVMAAALFFTVGGIFIKLSEGLTKFWPTMIVVCHRSRPANAGNEAGRSRRHLSVGGRARIHPRVHVRRFAVQRELHAGTNCRRGAHRRRHHLVALSLLTRPGALAVGELQHMAISSVEVFA